MLDSYRAYLTAHWWSSDLCFEELAAICQSLIAELVIPNGREQSAVEGSVNVKEKHFDLRCISYDFLNTLNGVKNGLVYVIPYLN